MKISIFKSFVYLTFFYMLSLQNCLAKIDYDQNTSANIDSFDNTSVLIYQNGRALVNSKTFLDLNPGLNVFRFITLPQSIVPESIHLSCLDLNNKIEIGQKKYVNGINRDKSVFLSRFKNSNVNIKYFNQQNSGVSGSILDDDLILNNDGLNLIDSDHKFLYTIPNINGSNLLKENSYANYCEYEVKSNSKGSCNFNLTYFINQLNASFQHVLVLNESDSKNKKLSLNTLVNIENSTGFNFKKIDLGIVAGSPDISHVNDNQFAYRTMTMAKLAQPMAASPANGSENVSDMYNYYKYNIPQKCSLLANETKSINLISQQNINYNDYCVYIDSISGYNIDNNAVEDHYANADNYIDFDNNDKNNLNIIVPAGNVMVYQKNKNNQLDFLGSSVLKNISCNQNVKIDIGKAYDLKIVRKILDKSFNKSSLDNLTTSEIEYELSNFSDTNKTLKLYISSYDKSIDIKEANYKFENPSYNNYEFIFKFKPHEVITLKLTAKFAIRRN